MTDLTKCSRAGCISEAAVLLDWRNPKIHTPDRVKTWGACDDHTQYLIDYLAARNFFLRTREIEAKHN